MHQIIETIRSSYNTSWLKWLFSNTSLASFFSSADEKNPDFTFEFFNNFLASNWFVRWWFRGFIDAKDIEAFDSVTEALTEIQSSPYCSFKTVVAYNSANDRESLSSHTYFHLHKLDLLYRNFFLLANHNNHPSLEQMLSDLRSASILNQESLNLVAKHNNPDALAGMLSNLQLASILNQESLILVANHVQPDALLVAIRYLRIESKGTSGYYRKKNLTQKNLNLVASDQDPIGVSGAPFNDLILDEVNKQFFLVDHQIPPSLEPALCYLQTAGILDDADNKATVVYYMKSINSNEFKEYLTKRLCRALEYLRRAKILNKKNFEVVVDILLNKTDSIDLFKDALTILWAWDNLTQENFDSVTTHKHIRAAALELVDLQEAGILNEENRALIAASNESPVIIASCLKTLRREGILDKENGAVIAACGSELRISLISGLKALHQANILNAHNREQALAHPQAENLFYRLANLQREGSLNQTIFDALIDVRHIAFLSEAATRLVHDRLAPHHLTIANVQRLLTASEQPNAMQALRAAINQILGIAPNIGAHARALNTAQSTHTQSVHRSASESARRLKDNYFASLDLNQKIGEIKAFINGLPDSPKNSAARRCIARITAVDYTHTDPVSDVSIRQLLALVFTAIHDERRRYEGSGTEDALNSFVEALYEIQRGYNLTESGQDQGGNDLHICKEGTFNKLLEKLNGVHPDVTIVMITKAQAGLKLPIVVREEALAYLSARANPATSAECIAFTRLMQSIKKDGIEDIWGNIKAQVAERMFDEFGSLYANQENSDFKALIESGQDLAIVDLVDSFQKELALSEGYRQYLSMILSASSMFAHNNSPEFASSLSTSAAPQ